jgi:hypothetical protein
MKKYLKADAATAQPTAIETKLMRIMQPDNMTSNGIGMKTSGIITFLDKSIYVQDLNDFQNSQMFEKGIKLIDSKVTELRRRYLLELLQLLLPNSSETQVEIMKKSKRLCPVISFVCDIAAHDNKKLAHPEAYDKDFKKYVANLFYHYFMDEGFEIYQYYMDEGFEHTVKLGSIPDIFVCPEKYFDFV